MFGEMYLGMSRRDVSAVSIHKIHVFIVAPASVFMCHNYSGAVSDVLRSGASQNFSQLNGLQGSAAPFSVWTTAWSSAQSDQQVEDQSVINGAASQQLRSSRAVLSDQQHDMLNLLDGTQADFSDISGMFAYN